MSGTTEYTALYTDTNNIHYDGRHIHGTKDSNTKYGYTEFDYAMNETAHRGQKAIVTPYSCGNMIAMQGMSDNTAVTPYIPSSVVGNWHKDGDFADNLNHRHKISKDNSNHQHFSDLTNVKATKETLEFEITSGGDSETAPKSIKLLFICYTGEKAPNWNN